MAGSIKGFVVACVLSIFSISTYAHKSVVVIPIGGDTASQFRIVSAGSSPTSADKGRLEYTADHAPSPQSDWGPVCSSCFSSDQACAEPRPSRNAAAMAVCKDMGYNFGFYSGSFYNTGNLDPTLDDVRCPDDASGFGDCTSILVNACATGVQSGVHCIVRSIAFVTSAAYDGNLVSAAAALPGAPHTGIEAGDALCQSHADTAGLTGVYKAWLSDSSSSPSSRFTLSDSGYYRLDGATIASDWDDLTDGHIDNQIDITELGQALDQNSRVRTGTEHDGTAGNPATENYCQDHTNSSGDVSSGLLNTTSSHWSYIGNEAVACSNPYHLYCFQQ